MATETISVVSDEDISKCVARAVAEGDIVNFRFLFVPFSPLRADSYEDLHTDKYAYLRPLDESDPHYQEALAAAQDADTYAFIKQQLGKNGPAQLPYELVLMLADNAVRLEKYQAASQAYELLRIRRRMQEEFLNQADNALDEGNISQAVRGYIVGSGLRYDYAAFPEPMPAVANYHTHALLLHAEYPTRPENSVALQDPETQVTTALNYLLLSSEIANRLQQRPLDVRIEIVKRLIHVVDPDWQAFQEHYRQACVEVKAIGDRLQRAAKPEEGSSETIEEQIEKQQAESKPEKIPAALLGREIPNGEWWQYLKELAYTHPAAVLFISRQAVSKDIEILKPHYRNDSPLVKAMGMDALS